MMAVALHALWVSVLATGAAALAESALRGRRIPARFVWGVALLLSVGLVGRGILPDGLVLRDRGETTAIGALPRAGEESSSAEAGGTLPLLRALKAGAADLAAQPGRALERIFRALPARGSGPDARMARVAALIWGGTSLILLVLLGAGLLHHRARRRRWPEAWVLGHRIRLTPDAGPAVSGLLHPEILLPRWALDCPPDLLGLILRHEEEQRRTRDPLWLALATGLVALVPWNPVAWWQLHRFRDAMEIDCDARVLQRGAGTGTVRRYGELLLGLATHHGPGGTSLRAACPLPLTPLAAPAAGVGPSQLERRLLAMRSARRSWHALAPAVLLALLLGASACLSDRPTPTDAAAEVSAEAGSEVPSQPAERATDPLPPADPPAEAPPEAEVSVEPPLQEGRADPAPVVILRPDREEAGAAEALPLIVVDGVILSAGAVDLEGLGLDSEEIASIEVVRGESATRLFGPRAARGVIHIRTNRP